MRKTSLIVAGLAGMILPTMAIAQSSRVAAYDDYSQTSGDALTVTGESRGGDVRQKLVALNDLDLNVDRDVRKADYRLRTAAANVCGVGRMNGSVVPENASPCYRDAFDTARVSLNSLIYQMRAG